EYISGNPNVKLISAPVCLTYSHTFFQKAQALEFSGLIGIGAACIAQKMPTMCNGANLIYQKSAYKNVNGFAGNETLASGDDEFMMHKIAAEWQDDVHFLKSQESIVYTSALLGIKAFLQQRKRWASKGKHYKSTKLTLLLASVYIFYALTLASLFLGFFHWKYFIVLIFALLLKCLPEWIFLRRISVFFNRKELMNCYFVTVLLQIVYVVIIGIYGNFGKYNWKGREVK
ncbi:MAG: glycosyl transferase, partial [Sphingobacteriales bacterium]